jgi:hypothetical protein
LLYAGVNNIQECLVLFAALLAHFKMFFQEGHEAGSVLTFDFMFNVFIEQGIHLFTGHGRWISVFQPEDQLFDVIIGEAGFTPEERVYSCENALKAHGGLVVGRLIFG